MDVQDLSEERVFQLLREAEERLSSSAQTMVVASPQVSLSARDARYVYNPHHECPAANNSQYILLFHYADAICQYDCPWCPGRPRVSYHEEGQKAGKPATLCRRPSSSQSCISNCTFLFMYAFAHVTFMRKIYPKDISTRNSGPVLGPSLHKMRAAQSAYS